MRNRELFTKKLELLEGKMKQMSSIVKTGGNISTYVDKISETEELILELKSLIALEPMTITEINNK